MAKCQERNGSTTVERPPLVVWKDATLKKRVEIKEILLLYCVYPLQILRTNGVLRANTLSTNTQYVNVNGTLLLFVLLMLLGGAILQ